MRFESFHFFVPAGNRQYYLRVTSAGEPYLFFCQFITVDTFKQKPRHHVDPVALRECSPPLEIADIFPWCLLIINEREASIRDFSERLGTNTFTYLW